MRTRLLRTLLPLALLVLSAGSGFAQTDPLPPATAPEGTAGSHVRAGKSVSGSLDASDAAASDGTYYDDWIYPGKRGERITITLRSEGLDTYLRFGRMKGGEFAQIAENDDGGEGSNSLLQMTLPADGDYVIRVNTLVTETGPYTLRVASRRP
jgi:hypothetical protein